MKKLYQEDLLDAGYELPSSGLFYSLDPNDAKALISEGEWLLSEDELIAKEGEDQQFLYMIVSGSVTLSKKDLKGNNQVVSDLTSGDAFGEVAFLRGHIASSTVETRGLCILWRMNHQNLLDFIGSHGAIAAQLCLNLAGLLADRVLKENKVVSQVRMDLDEAIATLSEANMEDSVKTAALKELQSKVENLNHATRTRRGYVRKSSRFNSLSMTSLAFACIAIASMFGLYNSFDHEAPAKVIALNDEIDSFKKNEAFYLDLKKRIEAENLELVEVNQQLKSVVSNNSEEIESLKESISAKDYEFESLKNEFLNAKTELANLISIEKVAEDPKESVQVQPSELYIPLVPQEFIDEVKLWALSNSTMAFPCEVQVVNKSVTLSDISLTASIEIGVGESIVVTRFHPVSEVYVVARKGDSDTFMASVHMDNITIMEKLAEKFVSYMKSLGKDVKNPFADNRFSQVDQNFSGE